MFRSLTIFQNLFKLAYAPSGCSGMAFPPSIIKIAPPNYGSLRKLLIALDGDIEARSAYRDIIERVGGTAFFAESGSHGLTGRKQLLPYLGSEQFVIVFRKILAQKLQDIEYDLSLLNDIENDLLKTVGQVLFGIPENDFNRFELYTLGNINANNESLNRFIYCLGSEANFLQFQNDSTGSYFSHVVSQMIKRQHSELDTEDKYISYVKSLTLSTFKEYLKHKEIRGLAVAFLAVNNLTGIMRDCIKQFIQNPELYLGKKSGLSMGDIQEKKTEAFQTLDPQSAFIEEALRRVKSIEIIRRTSKAVSAGGFSIPANCTVEINVAAAQHGKDWPSLEKFYPQRFQSHKQLPKLSLFSSGTRSCPAQYNLVRPLLMELMQQISYQEREKRLLEADPDRITGDRQLAMELEYEIFSGSKFGSSEREEKLERREELAIEPFYKSFFKSNLSSSEYAKLLDALKDGSLDLHTVEFSTVSRMKDLLNNMGTKCGVRM